MKTTFILMAVAASIGGYSQSFNFCECVTPPRKVYRWSIVEAGEVLDNQYSFYVTDLTKFLGAFGTESPNIYDFNGDGVVNMNELSLALGAFGVPAPLIELCLIDIEYVASHGWVGTYNGFFAIVHPTVIDESEMGAGSCPLNTFWLEVVTADGVMRYWIH